jgi:hypothetical protein
MRHRTWSENGVDLLSSSPAVADGAGAETISHLAGGEGGRGLGGEGGNPDIRHGGEGSPVIGAGGEGGGGSVSDVRLKEDVVAVGRTVYDLPLYSFRYKGAPEQYSGVMAQDVLEVMPEAVSVGSDGYYRVDYQMLGIAMTRLN